MYCLTQMDKNSSIYCEMVRQLMVSGQWKINPSTGDSRFKTQLYLGERNKLPFGLLQLNPGHKMLVNYYKGSDVICRKSELVRILRSFGLEDTPWVPKSFVIMPRSCKPDDRKALLQFSAENPDSIFILKPTAASKGLGMLLSRDASAIIDLIDNEHTKSCVVQQYIENPLLLHPGGRKFDIRCWVVVDQNFNAHFYQEGVLRTCSEPYDMDDLSNLTSHLSNHYLQEKLSENFGAFEENNEMFFEEFRNILDQTDISFERVLSSCKNIAASCLALIKERCRTDPECTVNFFQVFGFDYMVDCSGAVYLLEVNGAPACAQRLLKNFVTDLVSLVIESEYPTFENTTNAFEEIAIPNF